MPDIQQKPQIKPAVSIEIIPEEPHEIEEVWLEFFYQGKQPLGDGASRVTIFGQE